MSGSTNEMQLRLDELTRALHASEARFRSVIMNSADGIVIVDGHGLIMFANPAAQELFHRPAEELLGENFGLPVVAGETTELDIISHGRDLTVELRVTETEWDDRPARLLTMRDITERKNGTKRH